MKMQCIPVEHNRARISETNLQYILTKYWFLSIQKWEFPFFLGWSRLRNFARLLRWNSSEGYVWRFGSRLCGHVLRSIACPRNPVWAVVGCAGGYGWQKRKAQCEPQRASLHHSKEGRCTNRGCSREHSWRKTASRNIRNPNPRYSSGN